MNYFYIMAMSLLSNLYGFWDKMKISIENRIYCIGNILIDKKL